MRTIIAHIIVVLMLALLPSYSYANGPESCPKDTIKGKVYYRYTVEKGIGLYRISVNFGVTQEEILRANPKLNTYGVRYNDVLLIPVNEKASVQPAPQEKKEEPAPAPAPTPVVEEVVTPVVEPEKEEAVVEEKKDTVVAEVKPQKERRRRHYLREQKLAKDTAYIVDMSFSDSLLQKTTDTIRLAVMLPLFAEAINRTQSVDRFYDFYSGVLIALSEAQLDTKYHYELYTYDVGKTDKKVKAAFASMGDKRMDAIIGPVYAPQVAAAIDSTKEKGTWLLVPFQSKVPGIESARNVIKFNPSEQIEADAVAQHLLAKGDSVNCIVVETKEGEEVPSSIASLHQALNQYGVPTKSISLRALLIDSIDYAFEADKENIIIFNTEKYANLRTVMPHLLKAKEQYNLTLFSRYSWQNEKIRLPQLYTTVFDANPAVSQIYTEIYEQYFNHELASTHPRYDLLGYDLTSHLIQHIIYSKQTYTQTLIKNLWAGVQTNLMYIPISLQGGYENRIVHIVHK